MTRWRAGSVRTRTAGAAALVVALALLAGGALLVTVLGASLRHGVDASARLQAQAVATLAEGGRLAPTFPAIANDSAFVQVLDDHGNVVAASTNVADEPPLIGFRPSGTDVSVRSVPGLPIGDQGAFRVAGRQVSGPSGPLYVYVGVALGSVQHTVQVVSEGLIVGIPLLVLLVAALAWWLAGRALYPVEAVRAQVADITGHEDLGRRVPEPAGADELARLARTMNEMLDRLEAAAQRQRRFVADASHELRSPVASARTQLEVDLAHRRTADWPDTAAGVLADLDRVECLIGDLLALARTDGSSLSPPAATVDLAALVTTEVERARASAPVVIDSSAVTPVTVQGDEPGLRRAVTNLLDNACRHASRTVTVSLGEWGGAVELEVADDGAGIAAADRDRIFERFTRLDAARDRDEGGAGLGLAIVRQAVTSHGGTVRVEDANPGARFVVRLPAGAPTNVSPAPKREKAGRRGIGHRHPAEFVGCGAGPAGPDEFVGGPAGPARPEVRK